MVHQCDYTKPELKFPAAVQPFFQIGKPEFRILFHPFIRGSAAITVRPGQNSRYPDIEHGRMFFSGCFSVSGSHPKEHVLFLIDAAPMIPEHFIKPSALRLFCRFFCKFPKLRYPDGMDGAFKIRSLNSL